jgi:signal transduction histidine kinase
MPENRHLLHYRSDDIERVRELLDLTSRTARVGAYELDLKSQALFWSSVTREIHEVSDDFEPELHSAIDFYVDEDLEKIRFLVEQAIMHGESYDEQLRIRTAKGNLCWVRVMGIPEFVDGKCVRLYGTFQDINQIKMVEKVISEQKKYTESILEAIPDLIFVISTDGVFLEFRSGSLIDLHVPPEVFLGKHCDEVLPPDVSAKLLENIRLIESGISTPPFEYQMSVDGHLLHYEARIASLTAKKVLAVVRNITREKSIQRDLDHNRILLQETSEIARVGGWEIDLEHKRVYMSDVARQIHEIDESYVEPQGFEDLLAERLSYYKEGADRNRITTAVNNSIEKGTGFDEEVRIITARGREIWVRVIGTPEYKNGVCSRIHGSFHDIHDLKSVQSELERVLDLTRSQNDRLQQFAYIVSHNLRSHAHNVTSMVGFLMFDYPRMADTELGKNLIEMTGSLTETIENLTEIARMNTSGAQRLEEIDLSHTIVSALNAVKGQILQHNCVIVNEVNQGHEVMGIPAYMDSIVLNLLTNAIRYRAADRTCEIRLYMSRDGRYEVFHVQDNGLGMDLNRYGNKLFGMYKTFHNHPESRGIGLFMTKNQIEVMGGKISVESTPNVGTTFHVYFLSAESQE